MLQKITSAALALCVCVLVITAAIAVPILVRPFYYAQIDRIEAETSSQYSAGQIREAYDDVMDYLVFDGAFGTGELPYSQAGQQHFADCRVLFRLDFQVLIATAVLTLAMLLARVGMKKRGTLAPQRHLPVFWTAILSCVLFAALALWGAVDFDSLFVAFHHVFFPGKSNWLFDPATDAIIRILPEWFFLRCAALIAAIILAVSIVFLLADRRWRKHRKRP